VQSKNPDKSLNLTFRDLADGMRQQMYFWGRDAIHPDGNLFVHSGFQKRESTGLQGTSCYALDWHGGVIELHGSHAGWIGRHGGFLFIRPLGRCVRWLDAALPVPGNWLPDQYDTRADATLHALASPFFDWWLAHEAHVSRTAGPEFRDACFRQFKKLPKTRPWLTPANAIRWITQLRDQPTTVPRARRFSINRTPTPR
jgi:hypothetical protein